MPDGEEEIGNIGTIINKWMASKNICKTFVINGGDESNKLFT